MNLINQAFDLVANVAEGLVLEDTWVHKRGKPDTLPSEAALMRLSKAQLIEFIEERDTVWEDHADYLEAIQEENAEHLEELADEAWKIDMFSPLR